MLSEDELCKQFASRGTVSAGEIYLPSEAAIELVKACDSNNLAVIGVEGFHKRGRELEPVLDLILDLSTAGGSSWSEFRRSANGEAERFLKSQRLGSPTVYNFTILSDRHWRGPASKP